MRTDRFQPQGPTADPPRRDPAWMELLRSVPLGLLLGFVGIVFGWGVHYATLLNDGRETAARITRLETEQIERMTALRNDLTERMGRLEATSAKDMAALRNSLIEQMARMETSNNLRFDTWDKRGDARMAMLTGRFEKADARDDGIMDGLNQLGNRLTRVEALREFNAANGTGKK